MLDNDLTNSYWWSAGDYDWIMVDMGLSQPVGRVFVNFGWCSVDGTVWDSCGMTDTKYVKPFCFLVRDVTLKYVFSYRPHYVSMDVRVGDTSYSGYGHGSRVSGVNTRCVDYGTTPPPGYVSLNA